MRKCSKGFWIYKLKHDYKGYVYVATDSFIKALFGIPSVPLSLRYSEEDLKHLYFERSFKNGKQ